MSKKRILKQVENILNDIHMLLGPQILEQNFKLNSPNRFLLYKLAEQKVEMGDMKAMLTKLAEEVSKLKSDVSSLSQRE